MSEQLQEGDYPGVFQEIVVSTTKAGAAQYVTSWNIGDAEAPHVVSIYHNTSGKAWDYTVQDLTRMGFNNDMDAPAVEHPSQVLRLKYEEYQGKTRAKWSLAAKPQPADKNVVDELQARLKAAMPMKTTKAGKPTPKPTAPAPAAKAPPAAPSAPTTKPWTKDSAWKKWEGLKDASEGWTRVVGEIMDAEGIEEQAFTAAHWKRVADAADIPW
jgi:hypothetical protein